MLQIKRGCTIGSRGELEAEFEKTINCLKNDAGCVEVSRTGQGSDYSLTVELKYRDFPNFSLKMTGTGTKAYLMSFENAFNNPKDFFYSSSSLSCNIAMSECFLYIQSGNRNIAFLKDGLGEFYFLTDNNLYTTAPVLSNSSRAFLTLKNIASKNGKVLILDIFLPDFSQSDTFDFGRNIIGIKNIAGIKGIENFTSFSVDGQEYIRISNDLCAEVTS